MKKSKKFEHKQFIISTDKSVLTSKFVIISDLHGNEYGQNNEELVQSIKQINPNAVFFLGDIMAVSSRRKAYSTLNMFKNLARHYPCYFVNGNHEDGIRLYNYPKYKAYMKTAVKYGVQLLNNKSVSIGKNTVLHGFRPDFSSYVKCRAYDYSRVDYYKIFKNINKKDFNILLTHNPYVIRDYDYPFDLTCAGHFHGGGIRIKDRAVLGPNLLLFPKYSRGLYTGEFGRLIVSSGLGDHFPIFRINNPYWLVEIDVVGER